MKSTCGLHRRNGKPVVLLICIVAALCFSAGEGLRLTPFPANNIGGVVPQEGQLDDNGTFETSQTKYGPISLPKRTQARSKHKVLDVNCLSAAIAVNSSPRFCNSHGVDDASKVASLQLISRARDRAPPFSSAS